MTELINVLVVDDDADIRHITELALHFDARWSVRSAESAARALDVLASGWAADVILADVTMPGGSGLDLMKQVREPRGAAAFPFVLFTASVRQDDLARYHAAGVTGVIRKPFDPLALGPELRRILAAT